MLIGLEGAQGFLDEHLRRRPIRRCSFKVLVRDGLPLHGKKVDFDEASAWVEANVDSARKNGWQGTSLNDLRRQREEVRIETSKLELAKARGELVERVAVKRFLTERGSMERDSWLSWASTVSARLAALFGVDHGPLLGALEDEVRAQLRYLAEKPLEGSNNEPRVFANADSMTNLLG
jgi:hypothetical protein